MKHDTNKNMMEATHELMKKNGCYEKAEAILDYFLLESYNVQDLTSYQFDFVGKVKFGGSEGIYLDCYVEGDFDNSGNYKSLHCGTYKTLRDDLESMQIMGELAGSLTYYNTEFVNENINRYTPEGEPDQEDNLCMTM